jgi:DNA-directed RNA polymerase specialized sigma subunit
MMEKDDMVFLLKRWGRWQRSAKNPNLSYAVSQFDTPLQKQRNVTPIYEDTISEQLDKIILKHLTDSERAILELTYVEQQINPIIADILHCSVKTVINTKNEIIAALRGLSECYLD